MKKNCGPRAPAAKDALKELIYCDEKKMLFILFYFSYEKFVSHEMKRWKRDNI